jgi:hypothetical protein
MRRQIIKKMGSLLIACLLVTGIASVGTSYAATAEVGALEASNDTEYSIEEMLIYAIEDEYLAMAEYEVIMDTFGTQKPFSNIIKAEATHISLLEPLFEKYNVQVPDKDWKSLVTVPESVEAALAIGVDAEVKNIAMYESFLKEDLPEDVKDVFELFLKSSERHLSAFQRWVDGNPNGSMNCNGSGRNGMNGGNGNRSGQNRRGNRNSNQGTCLLDNTL